MTQLTDMLLVHNIRYFTTQYHNRKHS